MKGLRTDDLIDYKIEEDIFYIFLPKIYSIKTGALILELKDTIVGNDKISSLIIDAGALEGITEFGNEMFILRDRVLETKKIAFQMINISSDFERVISMMPPI